VQELSSTETTHFRAQFSPIRAEAVTGVGSLPYGDLKGPGLERLCFELLVSFGYEPRFFGRSGQPQYGVDLVAERAGKTEVYQCKNLSNAPTGKELRGYLHKFVTEWLSPDDLPRPDRFVIVCPQPLRDLATDIDWQQAKKELSTTWGIEASVWHLDLLEAWLKRKPDIVASLFSDRHVEIFCDLDEWNPDLFKAMREGASSDLRLRRYFERRKTTRLYLDQRYEQEITDVLEQFNVVLIRGLPGTGKTLTSLAVAESFDDCRWRTYFLDVGDDEFTKAHVRDGVRRRLSRRTIFVLENCHERPSAVESVLRDLDSDLTAGNAKIICLMRRVPGAENGRSDDSELFLELAAQHALVDFVNDESLFKRVIEFWRPEFEGLSKHRVAKLHALCGSNLLLLDEVLELLRSATDIDTFSAGDMYERVRRAYFSFRTADELRKTRQLAALAQFDVRPRADAIVIGDSEREVLSSLCVRAGSPPRWHFLHSSAAELILHALWAGMGVDDLAIVAEQAAQDICTYFEDLLDNELRPAASPETLQRDLFSVLTSRLLLLDEDGENRLKAYLLDSEVVRSLVPGLLTSPGYFRTLSLCALIAMRTGARATQFYARLLGALLEGIVEGDDEERLIPVLPVFGWALRTLKLSASPEYSYLASEVIGERLVTKLIQANGTIVEIARILPYAPPELARGILDALSDGGVATLIHNTITAGRSIGTIDFAFRELHRTEETTPFGRALEIKIGAARLLDLVLANGTLVELFGLLQYCSVDFAAEIIEVLSEKCVVTLFAQTIASGRSIGTFHLCLRDLERTSETSKLARDLERKLGFARFLELIEANGTLVDLLRIVQHTSAEFANELIDQLDQERVAALIDKMIFSGKSIGTLSFLLRSLSRRDPTGAMLGNLERKIGAGRFLRLIEANGTIVELFQCIEHASPDFIGEIVAQIDRVRIARLVEKTISAGRSIGTLSLSIREIQRRNTISTAAQELVMKIGPARLITLIEANGTFFELFKIIQQVPDGCAHGMIGLMDDRRVARLIQKTVVAGRSIGTLNYTLRDLHRRRHETDLGRALEKILGPDGFWALVVGTGSMGPLVDLLRDMSTSFQYEVVGAASSLTPKQWAQIIRRGDIFQLAEFIRYLAVEFEHGAAERALTQAVEAEVSELVTNSDWYALNTASKLLRDSPPSRLWHITSKEFDASLSQLEIDSHLFPTFRQAVNGLELLYERCPASRPILARDLKVLLPPPNTWMLNPKQDLGLPRILLRLVESKEFSEPDVVFVVESLAHCVSPDRLAHWRTVDILWTLWALFRLCLHRGLGIGEYGESFILAVVDASNSRFGSRLESNRRDELRARFALGGLLSLLAQPVDSAALNWLVKELAKDSIIGARWLTVNQSFVTAGLVLRGIDGAAPFPSKTKADFLDRLQFASTDNGAMDLAADYLYDDLVTKWS